MNKTKISGKELLRRILGASDRLQGFIQLTAEQQIEVGRQIENQWNEILRSRVEMVEKAQRIKVSLETFGGRLSRRLVGTVQPADSPIDMDQLSRDIADAKAILSAGAPPFRGVDDFINEAISKGVIEEFEIAVGDDEPDNGEEFEIIEMDELDTGRMI